MDIELIWKAFTSWWNLSLSFPEEIQTKVHIVKFINYQIIFDWNLSRLYWLWSHMHYIRNLEYILMILIVEYKSYICLSILFHIKTCSKHLRLRNIMCFTFKIFWPNIKLDLWIVVHTQIIKFSKIFNLTASNEIAKINK